MSKTLAIGDPLPDIELRNQDDQTVRFSEFTGKHAVVIFFYPKDETLICTQEACGFRDHYKEFENAGAKVFGISVDPIDSHRKFKNKYSLNFDLLSDPDRGAESAFGVRRNLFGLLGGRVTFVFNREGRLIHEFSSSFRASHHIKESLNALRSDHQDNKTK